MAGVTGLEPAASGVTGRRSNQLSYTPTGQFLCGTHEGCDVVDATRPVKQRRIPEPYPRPYFSEGPA